MKQLNASKALQFLLSLEHQAFLRFLRSEGTKEEDLPSIEAWLESKGILEDPTKKQN
jgi:hypothetical protein